MIKKYFVVCILYFGFCIFNSSLLYAQSFSGSFFGGLSSSQVAGDRLSGFNKAGIIAGGSVFLPLKNKLGLEMEMQFIQKGSKKPVDANSNDLSYYRMQLNYIEVPLLLHYSYSKRFHFNAGFSFGRLLSNKEEDEGGTIPTSQLLPFEKSELAVCGGMYYGFTEKFYLHLRLSNSILPIRKTGQSQLQYIQSGQYNSVLSFTLKYRLGYSSVQ
jgi:Outer membrane protein beta-barrel domain